MSNYTELLRDPRWQKKRLEIFERDNFTCQHCGSKERTLHVHHKRYIKGKNPWEYDNSNYITLCENCHEIETSVNSELYAQFVGMKEAFIDKGYSMETLSAIMCSIESFLRGDELFEGLEDNVRSLISYSVAGTQNLSDLFVLKSSGVDMREIMLAQYRNFIDEYDSIK